jgi:hypothetical protein
LLAEGEYSVPIAVEDSNVGAQHRGRLSRISREEAQKKLNLRRSSTLVGLSKSLGSWTDRFTRLPHNLGEVFPVFP